MIIANSIFETKTPVCGLESDTKNKDIERPSLHIMGSLGVGLKDDGSMKGWREIGMNVKRWWAANGLPWRPYDGPACFVIFLSEHKRAIPPNMTLVIQILKYDCPQN